MGFAEALTDDGSLSGRGRPLAHGVVCGSMTFLGGIGHALPFLIPDFWGAMSVATIVVVVELLVIAWIRNRYMDTPFLAPCFKSWWEGCWCLPSALRSAARNRCVLGRSTAGMTCGRITAASPVRIESIFVQAHAEACDLRREPAGVLQCAIANDLISTNFGCKLLRHSDGWLMAQHGMRLASTMQSVEFRLGSCIYVRRGFCGGDDRLLCAWASPMFGHARACERGDIMDFEYLAGGIMTVLLTAYLLYALLAP